MFLLWVLIAIIIGVGENVKDSYDAHQYHKTHPNYNSDNWWK